MEYEIGIRSSTWKKMRGGRAMSPKREREHLILRSSRVKQVIVDVASHDVSRGGKWDMMSH
jgi:hypothetical protein